MNILTGIGTQGRELFSWEPAAMIYLKYERTSRRMRDRLGSFGDAMFGLILAGIVASYVAFLRELIAHHPVASLATTPLPWIEAATVFQFIVVSVLWALQARIITRLFVDHVAFVAGYLAVLYFLFGWIMMEGAIPALLQITGLPTLTLPITVGSSLMIGASLGCLFLLGLGGLSYHWFELTNFARYECGRDCAMVALGAAITILVAAWPGLIQSPVSFMILISLVILARILLVTLDGKVLNWWGCDKEKRHQAKLIFAGSVLVFVFAICYDGLMYSQPAFRGSMILSLSGAAVLVASVINFWKQLHLARTVDRRELL